MDVKKVENALSSVPLSLGKRTRLALGVILFLGLIWFIYPLTGLGFPSGWIQLAGLATHIYMFITFVTLILLFVAARVAYGQLRILQQQLGVMNDTQQLMNKTQRLESILTILSYFENRRLRRARWFMYQYGYHPDLTKLFATPLERNDEVLKHRKRIDETIRRLSKNRLTLEDIDATINALNQTALFIKSGYVPRSIVKDLLANRFLACWRFFYPYIDYRRANWKDLPGKSDKPDAIRDLDSQHLGELVKETDREIWQKAIDDWGKAKAQNEKLGTGYSGNLLTWLSERWMAFTTPREA